MTATVDIGQSPAARPQKRRVLRRPPRRTRPLVLQYAGGDLLALVSLGGLLLAILWRLVQLPPTTFDFSFSQTTPQALVRLNTEINRAEILPFSLDRQPQVILGDFYPLEHSAGFAFRWSKPTAELTIPINVPADYRITITMWSLPQPGAPRTISLRVNDDAPQTLPLTTDLQDYTITYHATRALWAHPGQPALTVELATDPVVAAGDKRQLGVLVSRIVVAPLGAPAPWQPALYLPNLALLGLVYGVTRVAGTRVPAAAGFCAALLAAFAVLAFKAGAAGVLLAYQAIAHPAWPAALLLLHVAVLLAAWAVFGRRVVYPALAPVAGATMNTASNVARAVWLASPAADRIPATPAAIQREIHTVLTGGLALAVGLFATLRVAFSLAALLVTRLGPVARVCTWRGQEPMAATGLAGQFLGVWQRADACWYERIAILGYRPGDPSVAFFPLYPLLLRAVSLPLAGASLDLGARLALSGMIVSGVAYVVALTGVYQLVWHDFDSSVARRTVLALALFPSAFFFFAPFTEALFLALAVWALLFARRGAWWAAGVAALLASLTKTQGTLLALPLAWELYRQWHNQPPPRRAPGPAVLTPLLPLYGLLAFLGYTGIFTSWTTFQAQARQWGYFLHAPWTLLALSWQYTLRHGSAVEALNLGLLLLVAALLAAGWRRLPFAYFLYAVPHLVPILTRQTYASPLASASRYLLVLFPACVVLALLGRRRWLWYPWLLVSTFLLAALFYAFLTRDFVA